MTCSHCGFEFSEGFYCPGCGYRVTHQTAPPIPSPPLGKKPPQDERDKQASQDSPPQPTWQPHAPRNVDQSESAANQAHKSFGLRAVLGIGFLLLAIFFGMNTFSGPDSPGGDSPFVDPVVVDDGDRSQDFSINESCEEVRADFMNAAPGSDEERWALDAAEEVCFGQ